MSPSVYRTMISPEGLVNINFAAELSVVFKGPPSHTADSCYVNGIIFTFINC